VSRLSWYFCFTVQFYLYSHPRILIERIPTDDGDSFGSSINVISDRTVAEGCRIAEAAEQPVTPACLSVVASRPAAAWTPPSNQHSARGILIGRQSAVDGWAAAAGLQRERERESVLDWMDAASPIDSVSRSFAAAAVSILIHTLLHTRISLQRYPFHFPSFSSALITFKPFTRCY